MQTVNVTKAFVAISPVFHNEMKIVEEQSDGTILVTRARYDGAYLAVRSNQFRLPPRHEWEAGGSRYYESYVPMFKTIDLCRQHFNGVCGCRIIDITL